MARAYPRSEFRGIDDHAPSVEAPRARGARRASPTACASRSQREALPGERYELACVFDALHDMGDPAGAAAHVRRLVGRRTAGACSSSRRPATSRGQPQPGRPDLLLGLDFVCTPASRAQEVAPASAPRPARPGARVVTDAGFTRPAGHRDPLQHRPRGSALSAATQMKVTIDTDPGCQFGVDVQRQELQLMWHYGHAAEVAWRMIVLVETSSSFEDLGLTSELVVRTRQRLAGLYGMPMGLQPLDAVHRPPSMRAAHTSGRGGTLRDRALALLRGLYRRAHSDQEPLDDLKTIAIAAADAGLPAGSVEAGRSRSSA